MLQQRHVCSDARCSLRFLLYSCQHQKPTSPAQCVFNSSGSYRRISNKFVCAVCRMPPICLVDAVLIQQWEPFSWPVNTHFFKCATYCRLQENPKLAKKWLQKVKFWKDFKEKKQRGNCRDGFDINGTVLLKCRFLFCQMSLQSQNSFKQTLFTVYLLVIVFGCGFTPVQHEKLELD